MLKLFVIVLLAVVLVQDSAYAKAYGGHEDHQQHGNAYGKDGHGIQQGGQAGHGTGHHQESSGVKQGTHGNVYGKDGHGVYHGTSGHGTAGFGHGHEGHGGQGHDGYKTRGY